MKRNLTIVVSFFVLSIIFFMCTGISTGTFSTATGKSPEKNIKEIGIPAELVAFEYIVPDGMIEDPDEKEAMIEAKLNHLKELNKVFWGPAFADKEKLEEAFESTWDEVNNRFIGFKNLDVDWDAVYDEYINKVTEVETYGEYAYIITMMGYLLEDIHANLLPGKLSSEVVDDKGEIMKLERSNAFLNGAPVFVPHAISRIGACHTVTEDKKTVILKLTDDMTNPYNFKIGDEILGFNGIPWSEWYPIIENAGIPIYGCPASNPKAIEYFVLKSGAANAYLFEKINIRRVDTGEIETMDIVHIDDFYSCTDLTDKEGIKPVDDPEKEDISVIEALHDNKPMVYGIIKDLNIGYIYLLECPAGFDDFGAGEEWDPYKTKFAEEFENAILDLMDTDGIIIDLKYNRGGRDEPLYRGLAHLIKTTEEIKIFEEVERDANSEDRTVLKKVSEDEESVSILPDEPDLYYENPIIVMVGPNCVSACDYTVATLSKFPDTFTIIGKSNNGSFSGAPLDGYTSDILDEDYNIIDYVKKRIPLKTARFIDDPETVLRTANFIDIPVWFTKEDIIKGIDTVREYAIKLIEEQNQ